MNPNSVFDDSWYRVRGLKLNLLPSVELIRQSYRGEFWYVVCDKFGHRFFRIREATYKFICHLDVSNNVEEAWEKTLNENPSEAPGQGDVIKVLSQLYSNGLLKSQKSVNIEFLLAAKDKQKAQQRKQLFSSLLFLKIPLWNPDPFLRKTIHLFSWCFKPFGFLIWLLFFCAAISVLFGEWGRFSDAANGILSLSNLPYLYLSIILTKALHEFGHAYACRRYHCEVPQMGIMFLVFNPLPFVDVSASYGLSQKYKRVVVGIAGVVVEFFIASVALIIWANIADGAFGRICFNVVITASVSTILFNLNPLLRFDGYHILCDLLETPNLQGRAQQLMRYWVEKYFFKLQAGPCPAETRGEAVGFTFYFISSWIYRFFLMMGILLFVSKKFLIVGAVLAIVFAFMWVILPFIKGLRYLFFSPKLMNMRARSIILSFAAISALMAFLTLVPFPNYFRSDGIVKALPHQNVYASVTGKLAEIILPSGSMVSEGQVLAVLENESLFEEMKIIDSEMQRVNLIMRKERSSQGTQLESLNSYYESLEIRKNNLNSNIESLSVRAPTSGVWFADSLEEYKNNVITKGTSIGHVSGKDRFEFFAVVSQRDVGRIFGNKPKEAEVRLRGQYQSSSKLVELNAIPSDQSQLPSASLGYMGGGQIAVKTGDRSGSVSTEPFFEVRGEIVVSSGVTPNHGQTGVARFPVPDAPLWSQLALRLRQLFQREYRL